MEELVLPFTRLIAHLMFEKYFLLYHTTSSIITNFIISFHQVLKDHINT